MNRARFLSIFILVAALSWTLLPWAMAGTASSSRTKVQQYEGQIKSVKIDKCGMQPGSCEGSVILARAGGAGEVTLAIKEGTWLKRGDQLVTIDELGVGNYVKVEATQLAQEPLQRITILSADQGD